jgi:hypothetical protein
MNTNAQNTLHVKARKAQRPTVLIIAHFSDAGEVEANGRFSYIAENLAKLYDVELVSSDFSHARKQYRIKTQTKCPYKVTLLHEPAYRKNVSPGRLISHRKFAKNLKEYLNESSVPDLIYCAVPSLDVGDVARKYALSKNIPFIIDIQDIWPEAFKLVFNIPLISDVIFFQWPELQNAYMPMPMRSSPYLRHMPSLAQSKIPKSQKRIPSFLGRT